MGQSRTVALCLFFLVLMDSVHGFTFSASLDPKLGNFFGPQDSGWLGADVAASIPVPYRNGTYLWLWGDTLVGSLVNGQRDIRTVPRNSISLVQVDKQTPQLQEFYLKTDPNDPYDLRFGFFTPSALPNTTNWFWVYDALIIGKKLYVMASELATNDEPEPWNFETISTGVLIVEDSTSDPLTWLYTYNKFPHTEELCALWNGFTMDETYVYLTGHANKPGNSPTVLARIETSLFETFKFEEIEYWTNVSNIQQWKKFTNDSTLQGIFSDYPPGKLFYHPYMQQWYSVSLLPLRSSTIVILTANDITGPWSQPKPIFDIPKPWSGPNLFCYSILPHPEFQTRQDEIVFSFMCNGPKEDLTPNLWLYVPQFVRVKIN
eukprot:TRINITY_DN14157_c0_g1_i1.p1 TRINITY_DN14157_c0_g1~~TRINITY_DN14157_c0_g1_i1.p1  ORF type:complete len:376 (-),score=34.43 TRINITY_DN14157_c0_g1_i1:305-1432(-)